MTSIEIARRFAELNAREEAQNAYALALEQEISPEEELEAASYIFFSEGDYRVAYTAFVSLYQRGYFQEELLKLMQEAFYEPNVKEQKTRYEINCRHLKRYPYLFRKDFLPFDELPIRFFPYDDRGVVPYGVREKRFGAYTDVRRPLIDRWFFKDLSKPILTEELFSQYQLEYLNDTVRKSEWVGRENHIYLHYRSWSEFCAWLQVLDFHKLLENRKFVFLIEEEKSQYPIDFRERFGIDYTHFPVKPLGVREVNRLIWHTQLSAHNGGDFFNEIFHGHPNLLMEHSMFFTDTLHSVELIKKYMGMGMEDYQRYLDGLERKMGKKRFDRTPLLELKKLEAPSDKDVLVAIFMSHAEGTPYLDRASRIAPALFFQPHFAHHYKIDIENVGHGNSELHCRENEEISQTPMIKQFPYIKTFSPMRRITTSYASSLRFALNYDTMFPDWAPEDYKKNVVGDRLFDHILNRNYLVDPENRIFRDSRLVRFEDGKLNPKATFTALAQFLDLPYTESMRYCSDDSGVNPESLRGNDLGFDPAAVYRKYEEYANDAERAFLEFFMKDAYQMYGYDFQYYDGKPLDEQQLLEMIPQFTTMNGWIEKSIEDSVRLTHPEAKKVLSTVDDLYGEHRKLILHLLMNTKQFVNKNGQPLRMMTPLKLDPELLEQPLYH